MKLYKQLFLTVCILAVCTTSLFAQTATPYLGVQLSQQPLPQLLTKHLQLEPGRGVLVQNILIDSPADKAGLDKDDIIVQFNDELVTDYQQLTEMIQDAQVGQAVTLSVIQSGVLQDIVVELAQRRPDDEWGEWKYALPVESSQIWRPGRIFRFDPENLNIQIPETPEWDHEGIYDMIKNFSATRMYQYQHGSGPDKFTVMIHGNPNHENATVTVKAGDDEYQATIGTLDKIPEDYRQAVLEDIKKAKSYTIDLKPHRIDPPDFDHFKPYEQWKQRSGDINTELKEQMQQLQQQLKDLQEEWQEKFERLEKKLINSRRELQA